MQRYAIFNKSNKILITKTPDIDKQGFNGEIINCTSEVLKIPTLMNILMRGVQPVFCLLVSR